MSQPHESVLLNEVITAFDGCLLHTFVDCTLGAGGHSAALLKAHPEIKLLVGIDQDPMARSIAEKRLEPWKEKTHILAGNFRALAELLDSIGVKTVDGMLMDLGVSSMQLDQPEKGFSFMREGPLDMRMDPSAELTAAEVINHYSEQQLGRIFRDYGEEKQWRKAAYTVVQARPLQSTKQLADLLYPVLVRKAKKGIHPLTLIFQGLRIYVNQELEVLESTLPLAIDHLSQSGRLAVISFHSLEDRIVKNFFRYQASDKEDTSGVGGLFLDKKPRLKLLTRRPLMPTEEESNRNPRSRSAKMRVVELI